MRTWLPPVSITALNAMYLAYEATAWCAGSARTLQGWHLSHAAHACCVASTAFTLSLIRQRVDTGVECILYI